MQPWPSQHPTRLQRERLTADVKYSIRCASIRRADARVGPAKPSAVSDTRYGYPRGLMAAKSF